MDVDRLITELLDDDPSLAPALMDGRQWVADQFYGGDISKMSPPPAKLLELMNEDNQNMKPVDFDLLMGTPKVGSIMGNRLKEEIPYMTTLSPAYKALIKKADEGGDEGIKDIKGL